MPSKQDHIAFRTAAPESLALLRPADVLAEPVHRPAWRDLARCSSPEARDRVPYELAQSSQVLPLCILSAQGSEPVLSILAAQEPDPALLQELRFATGCQVVADTVESEALSMAIYAAYHADKRAVSDAREAAEQSIAPAPQSTSCDPAILKQGIPALLEAILAHAVSCSASDIHVEPFDSRYRIRYRIDGLLQEDTKDSVSLETGRHLVRRIKVLSRLDAQCISKPQDGGFTFQAGENQIRVRVSLLPQVHGDKAVLRLLGQSAAGCSTFHVLGLSGIQEQILRTYLSADHGAIVLSGPTGSGKSTLLYAALGHLNHPSRNIITLEDPVERIIPGVNQVQIRREHGLDYSQLLPPLLRQDPDIIMIGEIRDEETAAAAMNAAITGHLVLTTVHATNCLEVFTRLAQLGVPFPLIASALRLVAAQRLLPRNCRSCIQEESSGELLERVLNLPPRTAVWSSAGCERCSYSRIHGRLGVFELLPVTESVRRVLLEGQPHTQLVRAAAQSGYRSLALAVRSALLSGAVSPRMALRALGVSADAFEGFGHALRQPAA